MKNDIYKDELGNIRMKNIDVAQKFAKNIEKAFLKEFPKGECDAKIGRQNDYTKDITIFFRVRPKQFYSSIPDPVDNMIIIKSKDYYSVDFKSNDLVLDSYDHSMDTSLGDIQTGLVKLENKKGDSLKNYEKKIKKWILHLRKLAEKHHDYWIDVYGNNFPI